MIKISSTNYIHHLHPHICYEKPTISLPLTDYVSIVFDFIRNAHGSATSFLKEIRIKIGDNISNNPYLK